MRQLDTHRSVTQSTSLNITVEDVPAASGANNRYCITGFDVRANPALSQGAPVADTEKLTILFQNGMIGPDGLRNGVTIESLLAICGDRLQGFQMGPSASRENELALQNINAAIATLKAREQRLLAEGATRDREAVTV